MRVIIIHGTNGSPDENWLPWLADKIRSTGNEVVIPTFSTPEGQNLDNWRVAFAEQTGELTESTILVGHSMGVGLILRLLESSKVPIAGSFLVSGFVSTLGDDFFDPLVKSFFQKPFDWKRIKQNAGKAFVYHGTDDPYVPTSHADEIAKELGVKPHMIPEGKHLSAEGGFTELEPLWKDLQPLLDQDQPAP